MESGGGIELEKKKEKKNKFRALVNKLNIPNHNDPNWHWEDIPTP